MDTTSGHPATLLLKFLNDWNLEQGSAPLAHWPIEQIHQLLDAYNTVVDEATDCSHALLMSQPHALVLAPELSPKRQRQLIERSLLYGDFVLMPLLGRSKVGSDDPDRAVRATAAHPIDDLVRNAPLLRTGLVLPMDRNRRLRRNERDDAWITTMLSMPEWQEIIQRHGHAVRKKQSAEQTLDDGTKRVVEIDRFIAEFDGMLMVKANIVGNMTATLWDPEHDVPDATLEEINTDPELCGCRFEAAVGRIRSLCDDLEWARQFSASTLVAGTTTGWNVLSAVDEHVSRQQGYPPERVLTELELPAVSGIDLNALVEVRDRASDAFARFRHCIDEIAHEAAALEPAARNMSSVRRVFERQLYDPLRELHSASRSALRRTVAQTAGDAVCVGCAAGIAFVAGASVGTATLAGGVLAAGFRAVDATTASIAESHQRKSSPAYVLWRSLK